MNNLEMAKALFGGSKEVSKSSGQTTTVYGVAASDSSAGFVMVDLGGDTVSPDDDQIVEVETTFAVKEGDEVIVQLVGADGTGKNPTVIGVVGRGDETQAEIEGVTNYFWTDADGVHVTTTPNSISGRNVLLDNDSLDIRNGTSVLASFGTEVTIGSRAGSAGSGSQVFGWNCKASGAYSHAEGTQTQAVGMFSHAEGYLVTADGQYSHAEGYGGGTHADYTHSEGYKTLAGSNYQHVQGKGNVPDNDGVYCDIIGNGTDYSPLSNASNAYNMDWNGNAEFQGSLYEGGCTPNGETPYPVVRYNTSASQSEYWSGSAWTAVPGGGGGHNYATRSVAFTATINGGGNAGDNLYDRINNDLPAGWSFFTISGTATNSGNGLVLSAAYRDGSASLRVRNMGTASATITTTIYYIAVQN